MRFRARQPASRGTRAAFALALAAVVWLLPGAAVAESIVEGEIFRLFYRSELRSVDAVAHLPDDRRVSETLAVQEVETHALETVRLMLWGQATPFISFEIAYEHVGDLARPAAEPLPTVATPPPAPDRFLALEWTLHESDALVWKHAFDRLYVGLHLPVAEGLHFTFGRQILRWGYGRIWVPADRFAPPRPLELYREYAPGLDAVRVSLALGFRTSVDVVFVPAEQVEDLAALTRLETAFGPVELAVTAGVDHHLGVLGAGARIDLGLAAIHGEGLWILDPDGGDRAAAVLGTTIQLPFGIVGTVEFAHDGAGSGSASRYPALWGSREWTGARLVGVGRWYAGLDVAASPLPDLTVGARAIVNIEDGSAALHFHFSAAISDEAWLGLSAVVGLGAGGRSDGGVGSEFGVAPHTYLLDLRLYF